MINKPFRWYHYAMPSFHMQVGIMVFCFFALLMQAGIYDVLEQDIVVFDGQCDVTVGPVLDGEVRQGAVATCGGETRNLGVLEAPYLYEVLTGERVPVIVCQKTQSEYLKEIHWSCEMDPEESQKRQEP